MRVVPRPKQPLLAGVGRSRWPPTFDFSMPYELHLADGRDGRA